MKNKFKFTIYLFFFRNKLELRKSNLWDKIHKWQYSCTTCKCNMLSFTFMSQTQSHSKWSCNSIYIVLERMYILRKPRSIIFDCKRNTISLFLWKQAHVKIWLLITFRIQYIQQSLIKVKFHAICDCILSCKCRVSISYWFFTLIIHQTDIEVFA